jgi:hypothetical protein
MPLSKVTGAVEIMIDGVPVLNKAGAVATGIGLSGEPAKEVTPIMGDGGLHGYKEDPIMAGLEVTVTDRGDIMIDDLMRIGLTTDGTILFQKRGGNGKKWTLQNAVAQRNASLTAGEGETSLTYFGEYWIEEKET